jgi:hypothetical protein
MSRKSPLYATDSQPFGARGKREILFFFFRVALELEERSKIYNNGTTLFQIMLFIL